MNNRAKAIWKMLGFYGLIYLVILVPITIIGHPFSKQFLEPLAALIFPIAEGNTLIKSLLIVTLFYWGAAVFSIYNVVRQSS